MPFVSNVQLRSSLLWMPRAIFSLVLAILGVSFSSLAFAAPCSQFSNSIVQIAGEYFSRKALRVYHGPNNLHKEFYLEASNPISEPTRILGSIGEGLLVTQHSKSHVLISSSRGQSYPQHLFDTRALLKESRPEAGNAFYQREITGFAPWSSNEFVLELTDTASLEAVRRVPSLERNEAFQLLKLSDEERPRSVLSLQERKEILQRKKLERGLRQLV
ncbi:MAG: hypothetical protein WCH11_02375 [Bdellovibrio sp.]